jgi:hypothetical protein
MFRWALVLGIAAAACGLGGCATAGAGAGAPSEPSIEAHEASALGTGARAGRAILFYLPDRALDLIDPFRVRLRLGPGMAIGARATSLGEVYIGSYATVFAGLPGPRRAKLPRLPGGVETRSGLAASVVDASLEGPLGPGYTWSESGASLQAMLVGFDVGLDPIELLDLLAGVVFLDPRGDDL